MSGYTNTVPSLAASYISLSSAVSALNSVTAINGPVTFNMNSGTTESSTAQITLTQAGSILYPITFQKAGSNANPKLTRTDAGTNTTTGVGGFGDAVLRIDGTDNIVFNGLDIAASNQGIEYGYFVHKPNAVNGAQNLSIKNATVTMTKGTNGFVIGIYVDNGQTALGVSDGLSISAVSGQNSNIVLTGNTIQNVHKGIFCYGYYGYYLTPYYADHDFIIGQNGNGNIIQNFGGGTASESAAISTNYIAHLHVDYNTINNTAAGGVAHTSILYGLDIYGSQGNCSFNNNSITLSNTSGEVDWISNYTFGFSSAFLTHTADIHNNTFAGTIGSSSNSYLIYTSVNGNGAKFSTQNNATSGTITKGGVSGDLYGYYFQGNTNQTELVRKNNFSNLSSPGSCYGIYSTSTQNDTTIIDSNIVSNLNSSSVTFGYVAGIHNSKAARCIIRDNIVSGLNGISVDGINIGNSNNPISTDILRNKIYSLNSSSTATNDFYLAGLNISTFGEPGNVKVYNNLIGLLTAPGSNSLHAISGIELNNSNMIDHFTTDVANNTIYFNASSSAINFGSAGVYQYASSTGSTFDHLLLRNNIIINLSTPKGSGLSSAIKRSSIYNGNFDPNSNRNLYYAGTPSATNVIFTNGTNILQTLSSYQNYMLSAVPAAEHNSFTENINFQSLTGSNPNFLKFDQNIPTAAESGAAMIEGLSGDYQNSIRANQPGYTGTGLAPDLGAWEFEGAFATLCSGIPSTPTAFISNSNPCTDSTFGVYINPIYPTGTTYQWQISLNDSVTGFSTISGATESYYVTSTHNNAWYRCLVTCVNGNQSILSNAVQVNVTPLSGTYVISNTGSGNYTSFAAAIADLHCRSTSGPVTFEVVDGQIFTETSNLSIRYTGNDPVTFRKQGNGNNPIIRRAGTVSTSNYILELLGADHIIFDGIDFEQTGTATASWVEYGIHITNSNATNGAQFNTFKNGTITLSNANANAIGVYSHSTSPIATSFSGTNSFNRFVNMTVQQAIQGYRFDNTGSNVEDDGNEIVGENGLRGNINTLGNGVLTNTIYGIYASEEKNFKVDSIDIYGIQAASFSYGIYSNSSDSSIQIFSNNNIQFCTSSSSFRGMALYNLKHVKAFNNEIHELNSTSTSSGNILGMAVSCDDSSFIYNNKIYNLSTTGTNTPYVFGINLSGSGIHTVYNNMISDLRAGASSFFPTAIAGIDVEGDAGGELRCYHNSIYLNDIGTNASYRAACIFSNDTTVLLDLRNNVFINTSNVTTGTNAVGLIKYYHNQDKIASTCNNNLWYSGTPDSKHLIYYALSPSTSAQTITQFKALTTVAPAEASSVTGHVSFIPSLIGELRPNTSIPTLIESRGQAMNGIAFDFENDMRNSTTPDLGADEGNFTLLVGYDCPVLNTPVNLLNGICPYETVTLTWSTPASGLSPLSYDVFLGTSSNPPLVSNTTSLSYTIPSLQGNSTYYWRIVAKYSSGNTTGCTTRSFTTGNTGITSVTNGQRCGPGVVNLSATGGGTIQWYSTLNATTPFTTGSTYSPNVSTSTNYYVSSLNGYGTNTYNAGKASLGTPSSAGASATEYLSFNVLSPMIIDSVVVYPSSSGNAVLQLTNSAGTILFTASRAITASQIGAAVSIAVNWPVGIGSGYRIYKPASSVNLLRNTTGATYPYTLASIVSITGSSPGATYYSWAYNWSVRTACESPRQVITATINNSTSTNVNISACNTYTWPVNGATYTTSGIYTFTSLVASGCVQTDSLILSIGVSGNNPPVNITACGSYTWPVNGITYTSSGNYTANFQNTNGCDSSWHLNLTIQSCSSNLQVKLFLQGYYIGNGIMTPALMNEGIGTDTSIVDFVTIELRDALNYNVAASSNVLLQTNGMANTTFGVTPGSYYVVVKHRNTIETWSANPLTLNGSPLTFDFTNASSNAYGNNMTNVGNNAWALFTGDINNDGNVDMIDMAAYEVDVNNLAYGYYTSDANGDGNVDLLDAPILETNMSNFIFTVHP